MRKTILSCAAVALLAVAPAADAAQFKGTLDASSPTFDWNGGPGNNVGVNVPGFGGVALGTVTGCSEGIADCDETLLKIDVAGKLVVKANSDDDSTDALDLYLYESNEAGEYDDGSLVEPDQELTDGSGATEASDETLEFAVKPGYYVAQVRFFDGQDITYKGNATLSGFPAPAPAPATPVAAEPSNDPAPAPQSQPAPQQQSAPPAQAQDADQPKAKKKSKKAACQKKAKKIKNKGKRKKALKKCSKIKG